MQKQISAAEINRMDLVDYLAVLGYKPDRVSRSDYWYLSPLRKEKTPSFKINRKLNVWYDHGIGAGGTLIDFGMAYFKCTAREFILRINSLPVNHFSFHPPGQNRYITKSNASTAETAKNQEQKIIVVSENLVTNPGLIRYLKTRAIDLEIARTYCQEIGFRLYHKTHLAIGFKNNAGGYELRSENFKGSSSPKEPRMIEVEGAKQLNVFEGFFSFLSFKTLQQKKEIKTEGLSEEHANNFILNSVSFFEKSRSVMERFSQIHLFLDRDVAGIRATQKALSWSAKYQDQSHLYSKHKDLNEYLKEVESFHLKQNQRPGKHFRI